jgi:hypothetical protein
MGCSSARQSHGLLSVHGLLKCASQQRNNGRFLRRLSGDIALCRRLFCLLNCRFIARNACSPVLVSTLAKRGKNAPRYENPHIDPITGTHGLCHSCNNVPIKGSDWQHTSTDCDISFSERLWRTFSTCAPAATQYTELRHAPGW